AVVGHQHSRPLRLLLQDRVVGFIYPFNQQMSTGDFHLFIGMLMLLPALGLMMLASWFLGKLVTPAVATPAGGAA
ncbi:MAG: hypothetical protein WCH61_06635, partial [bacterium]